MKMNWNVTLKSLSAVLLVVIVALGCNRTRKTSIRPLNQNSSSASEPAAPGEISAEDLFAEYQQDKDAADRKYKGKVIVVSGTVDTIKAETGNPYITMKTSSLILRVQCIFKSADSSAVGGLTKGQTVHVRGKVFGRIGNVVLQDCEML
jgi:hypothetical protein